MSRTIIIAEAGVNHNGDMNLAKELIDVAADAGADYVKFQTFKADKLVTTRAKKAEYQIQNTRSSDNSQFQMLKRLELSQDDHEELISHCNSAGIKFLSTPFDEESLRLLMSLNINLIKIPSGEITNGPHLELVGQQGKPIILSTGMSTMQEVLDALKIILNQGIRRDQVTILHCNTDYPTSMADVHLNAMKTISHETQVKIGYSDHTLGIEVPIAAVAMGASCIEKHITLDRNMPGPDHKASLEPRELKNMVKCIRNIELAMGNHEKRPTSSESKNLIAARKSICLARDLEVGHVLSRSDLTMKRPGDGISPMSITKLLGKKMRLARSKDHQLKLKDLHL